MRHFVTLIEICMHLIRVNPGHIWFSRSQIRCYVTIYAICCETTSNTTRVSPKHKARVNANMRLVTKKKVCYNFIVKGPLCVTRYMGILRMTTFEINKV